MLNTRNLGTAILRRLCAPILAILSGCILISPSMAQVIIDGDGFESVGLPPTGSGYDVTFAPIGLPVGSLEGQHASLPGDSTTAPWLASVGTDATAIVQTTVVHSGTQAVEVHREVGDAPSFWGVPVTAWPDSARFVCIEWDMLVEGPSGNPSTEFGPYFGVDAIDDVAVSGSDFGLMGSMGVLGTSGDVVYTDELIGLKPTGATVDFGEWNHFHIDLDFDLHEYTVILNGAALLTTPFVGGPAIGDGGLLDDFSDAPIGTFAFDADLPGTAYFDNYIVYQLTTKIPEPTTLVMGLVALISVSSLSRRRS